MPISPEFGGGNKLLAEVAGATALLINGVVFPLFFVFSAGLQGAGWPYYRMNATVFFLIGVVIFAWRAAAGTLSRSFLVLKWVFLRGIFGAMNYVFGMIAAPLAPIGDIIALGTMNIVAAALVGKLFLNEKLGRLQVLACVSSLLGATLITRPSFIFGGAGIDLMLFVGYTLAIAAGFSLAGAAIASRRLSEAPVSELSASAFTAAGLTLFFMPLVPGITDGSWGPVFESPHIAVALMVALGVVGITSSITFTVGSKWLPAAVSATLTNAATLLFGYLFQWVFFAMAPGPVTVMGSVLMLISVVLVAATKAPPAQVIGRSISQLSLMGRSLSNVPHEESIRPTAAASTTAAHAANAALGEAAQENSSDQATPDTAEPSPLYLDMIEIDSSLGSSAAVEKEAEEDEQSFTSFIATEFGTSSPKARTAVRKRVTAAGTAVESPTTPVASVLGMVSTVALPAV